MKFALSGIAITALAAVASALPFQRNGPNNGGMAWDLVRSNIKHVIYLMMENHSFDNIAGYWDFHPDINNLRNLTFCNQFTNPNWTVYGEPLDICAAPYEGEVPLKDPDHNFAGTTYEIYRDWYVNSGENHVPNMGGFVERESNNHNATPGDSAFVIKSYNEKKVSTLVEIAKNFAFFDSYHAEHPGPTNPNRQFATSGSTCGAVDDANQSAGFWNNVTGTTCAVSIFESLSNANITWKNYYETEIVDAFMYKWVQDNAMDRLAHASQFYKDIEEGTLPQFSYYNPECCTIDSMHPESNPAAGQQLIKHLYDSVRNSKYWDNVLIIVNFDEHGGFADHVPPPINIPQPEDGITFNGTSDRHHVQYDFTRLGIRVPAFLISPYIAPNTLISNQGTMYAPNSAYTHTSMLHFLQELWGLKGLNNRVQWAKTFEYVFSPDKRTDTPKNLTTPVWYGGSSQPQPKPFYLLNQDYSYYANL